jgi:hypothetical protein
MGWSGPARSGSYSGPGPTSPFCSAWPRLGLAAEIDKGVAILDYALDDRPSTGKGGSGRSAISPTCQGSIGSWRTERRKGIGGPAWQPLPVGHTNSPSYQKLFQL